MGAKGIYIRAAGIYICAKGIYTRAEDIYICAENVYTRAEGIYNLAEDAYTRVTDIYICAILFFAGKVLGEAGIISIDTDSLSTSALVYPALF